MAYYITTLLVYAGVDAIACLALSQQFGVAGVTNFGFIIFQAAGAYAAAVLSLPSDSSYGGFQTYIGGLHLPFPLPWIGAALVGGLFAVPFSALVGKRLRGDFAAVGLLVTAVMVNLLVTNYRPFLNGDAGLALVPAPLGNHFNPLGSRYQWGYSAVAIVLAFMVYRFVTRVTESPYGRTLRAMREDDVVADSLGKNVRSLRTSMLVLGGALAGLSGGVLVGFINLWDPAAWGYAESIVLFAAVIIGGLGNHKGAMLGAVLVPVVFLEASRYLPEVGRPGLVPALQWVAVGIVIVSFLWFRPQGIIPERRRVIALDPEPRESVPQPGAARPARRERLATAGIALEARGIGRSFDGVRAVDGVSVAFERARLTGLIGPNGAGKSTLLAMLAGTLEPSEGAILLGGDDITHAPAYRRARQGLVRTFQLASEFKRLTVLENLLSAVPSQRGDSLRGALLGKRYWGSDERAAIARAEAMLARFGLTAHANTYAGDLSGGQRRLVEIMRALMADPQVLLLDEPMAGVHPELAQRIGNILLELCDEGITIVMVEHELAIMDEFADPVVVMAGGRILAQGTMTELRAQADVVEAYLVG
ncbi:MAG: branched-chain amino acid transport system permease protein [Gaiellales bacterium]|nr:branched-chain amino acid transport system permease protein [Gaiellales bacterium]